MVDYMDGFTERLSAIGARARALRLLRGLQQYELAQRAGVGVMTVRRFEKTGTASIENVLRIANALNAEQSFDALFAPPPYSSLDEALERDVSTKRQRAPRHNK